MRRDNLYTLIILIAIVLETFSLINGYIKVPHLVIIYSVVLLNILYSPRAFLNKISFYYVLFLLIVSINIFLKQSFDPHWYFIIFSHWTFVFSIFQVLFYKTRFKNLNKIAYLSLFILVFTTIINIPLLVFNPTFIRETIVALQYGNPELYRAGQRLGIASYGIIHSIPMLFPFVIFKIKNTKIQPYRFMWIVVLIVLFYFILNVSFGTALILSLLIIPLSFILSDNKKRNLFTLFFSLILLSLFVNNTFVIEVLNRSLPLFEGTAMEYKIVDIQSSLLANEVEGQLSTRSNLYESTWKTFFTHPIFGTGSQNDVGGHAFIVDFLAWFGIVGVIPLVLLFLELFKTIFKSLPSQTRVYYFMCIIPFILLSFLKGTPYYEQLLYLFIVLPGLFMKKAPLLLLKNKYIFNQLLI